MKNLSHLRVSNGFRAQDPITRKRTSRKFPENPSYFPILLPFFLSRSVQHSTHGTGNWNSSWHHQGQSHHTHLIPPPGERQQITRKTSVWSLFNSIIWPYAHFADGLQMFVNIKNQRPPLHQDPPDSGNSWAWQCLLWEKASLSATLDYSRWPDVWKDGLGRTLPWRESLCDVPDGSRFPFQQPVNAGRQPAVSQVGASEDSLATIRRWYNKPWGCCGIWERAGWCLTWISKNQLAKL